MSDVTPAELLLHRARRVVDVAEDFVRGRRSRAELRAEVAALRAVVESAETQDANARVAKQAGGAR